MVQGSPVLALALVVGYSSTKLTVKDVIANYGANAEDDASRIKC